MQIEYPSVFYNHVHVDVSHDLMKHVIGTKGRWFKSIIEKCNVTYIWFNKKRSIVEIWGPIHNLMAANYSVRSRINFIKDKFPILEQDQSMECDNTSPTYTWSIDKMEELDLVYCLDVNYIKYLIGRNGFNFKEITRKSGVSFIWYNTQSHGVQIWGLPDDIVTAKSMLMIKVKEIVHKFETEVVVSAS